MTEADLRIEATGVSVGYDGLAVARGIDVRARPGEVLAVLGPNGAGKSTLLLTLAGFLPPIEGTVLVDGRPLKDGSPRHANRAGVVLVPDSRALFTQLSPMQNLALAARRPASIDEALELFPALARRAKLQAGALSGGEQQMLAVARALVQEPRVLLVDEMSMGLAPVVVESLMPLIRRVADERGAAVVLVEQHVHRALEIADQALVIAHGDVRLSGTADEVRGDALAVEAAYLGAVPAAE